MSMRSSVPVNGSQKRVMSGSSSKSQPIRAPGSPAGSSSSHVESSVTKLLVTTKQLLESLTGWSEGNRSAEEVSDCFVATGNYFNTAVLAFQKENISMDDLLSVPDDLRSCLEEALSQDQSTSTLEVYLPQVKEVVVSLLKGLKIKQEIYHGRREAVSSPRLDAPLPAPPVAGPSQPRTRSPQQGRASAGLPPGARSSKRELPEPGPSKRPISPPPRAPSRDELSNSRNRPSLDNVLSASDSSLSKLAEKTRVSGRYSDAPPMPKSAQRPRSPETSLPASGSSSSIGSRTSTPPPASRPAPLPAPAPSPPPMVPEISADLSPLPWLQPERFEPFLSGDAPSPNTSLERLQTNGHLERRASKRYSAMTYHKITASASGQNIAASGSEPSLGRDFVQASRRPKAEARDLGKSANRRPSAEGSLPPSRHVTPSRLGALPTMEEDEDENSSLTATVPPLPPTISAEELVTPTSAAPTLNTSLPSYPMTVFLQVGRDMKKAVLDESPSLATLRILFTERFQYNPGMSDFPSIYLRDPKEQHGVQYELEEMTDVREGCVLSLNIEPLDAVKESIATGLAALQQELKASLSASVAGLHQELKELQISASKGSLQVPLSPLAAGSIRSLPGSPNLPRPSEQHFQSAAQKVLTTNGTAAESIGLTRSASGGLYADAADMSPTLSMGSHTTKAVGDLKTHYDEVQGVRREIAALRQIINDFNADTKATLGGVRAQAAQVRHLASTKIGAERAAIRAGKEQFEKRMDDLIPRLEELQDTVDDLRNDVTSKGVRPRQQQMNDIKSRLDTLASEVDGATQQLSTLGPAWKHGWEQELEVIIREQEFLRQQEPLLRDAAADLTTLTQVFQTIEQYTTAVGGSGGSDTPGGRRTPKVALAAEEPGDHATVMASVRALAPDPQRRLRAIEQAEKAREADLANRSDAFKDELGGFVEGKRLRKTGGTEETERVREVKSTATLRAMLSSPQPLPNGSAADGLL